MWQLKGALVITKVLVMVAVGLLAATASVGETREDVGVVISTIGSERATTGSGNKIVTYAGKSHVVWQDATKDGYFNRICTYDHNSGEWTKPVTLNKGIDNHARPVITVDRQGYLHTVMSGHHTAITYRLSKRPNDSSTWTSDEEIGSGTYPAVVCGPDDTLLVTARARGHRGVTLLVRPEHGKWEQKLLVYRGDGWTGYSTFTSGMTVGPDGTVHFVCNVGRGKGGKPGLYQSVGYLRSRDGGKTWEKANGTSTPIPILPENMDVLVEANLPPRKLKNNYPEFPELVTNGNIVTDSAGVPYVLYISHLEKPGQLIFAAPNERGEWTQKTITAAERKYPDMRPIGVCFPMTITADDAFHILMELVPLGDDWVNGKPERLMNFASDPVKRLVRLVSTDGGRTFTVQAVIEPGAMFNMVNIERPAGSNTIPAGRVPPWIYFDGSCANGARNNNVYWVNCP